MPKHSKNTTALTVSDTVKQKKKKKNKRNRMKKTDAIFIYPILLRFDCCWFRCVFFSLVLFLCVWWRFIIRFGKNHLYTLIN